MEVEPYMYDCDAYQAKPEPIDSTIIDEESPEEDSYQRTDTSDYQFEGVPTIEYF
jgi:hypothetical protein